MKSMTYEGVVCKLKLVGGSDREQSGRCHEAAGTEPHAQRDCSEWKNGMTHDVL